MSRVKRGQAAPLRALVIHRRIKWVIRGDELIWTAEKGPPAAPPPGGGATFLSLYLLHFFIDKHILPSNIAKYLRKDDYIRNGECFALPS
jgi:hypothetical protein